MFRSFFLVLGACLLVSCTSLPAPLPSPQARRAFANDLAARQGWTAQEIATGQFGLLAYAPRVLIPGETLTVYLEGDGFAWVTSTQPSLDPTPRDPLGLRLALAHPAGNAAYLARPCQYVDAQGAGCAQRYWTTHRFAQEVIEASDKAIDLLMQRFGASRLVLVGYSGGGAVATLLAERRSDVVRLVTVAGNLDHRAWSRYHHISALNGSLNPADAAVKLSAMPQTHFVGGRDRVIPLDLARNWPPGLLGKADANLHVIPAFTHECCWAEHWAGLINPSASDALRRPQ